MAKLTEFYPGSTLVKEVAEQFFEIIAVSEDIMSRWLPGTGKTHFAHTFHDKTNRKNYLPDTLNKKLIFILLDADLNFNQFTDQIRDSVELYSNEKNARKGLLKLINENYEIFFFVDNFKFEEDYVKYLSMIRSIHINKINMILLTLYSEFDNSNIEEKYVGNFFFHNIIDTAYPNKIQSIAWIKQQSKELKVKLSSKDMDKVWEFCGNIPVLQKNYIRKFRKYKNHEKVKNSVGFNSIVKVFFDDFSQKEQHVIKQLHISNNKKTPYLEILEYFKRCNLVDSNNHIIGEWINNVLSFDEKIVIELKKDSLNWEGYNLTGRFSKNEIEILRAVLGSKGIVSRERIAKSISNEIHSVSEWSIDKTMSRLRKKLDEIGIGGDKIVTVKGEGYRVEGVKVK